MRHLVIVSMLLMSPPSFAVAQVSVQIGLPGVSVGINQPVYPELVPVPGYPVYYAPRGDSNYFFYDGMYWVYQGDDWYVSSWYNGPWARVAPQSVPVFILRVPVRYYRHPPAYFQGWRPDAPPRWGEHWGNDWERQRGGWDRWDRAAAPRPAPLPTYQRQYAGDRYPQPELQPALHGKNYHYVPRSAAVRQAYQAQGMRAAPPSPGNRGEPAARAPQQQEVQRGPPAVAHGQGGGQGHDKGSQGKGGGADHQGGPGSSKGEDRGSEHGK
jgi:hypothetical protein